MEREEAKYTFHALRHFYASLAIDTGMNPKRLQTLMGHSSITVTLDIYSHLFPSEADDRAKIGSVASGVLEAA
jgi:integrase